VVRVLGRSPLRRVAITNQIDRLLDGGPLCATGGHLRGN
jgi:hypothetical protein